MKKRPLLPGILNKLDNYLLIYKPEVWSARTHLATWYSLLFMLTLSALCFINYGDARVSTNVAIWVGFVVIISILALVVWIIYLLRFNVFKRFGTVTPASRLITFILYFIAAGMMVAYSFIPLIIETIRAQHDYNNNELVNDINEINTKICQVEYNKLPTNWRRDSARIVDSLPKANEVNLYASNAPVEYDSATNSRYRLITKEGLQQIINNKDSVQKINDSMYILFDMPDFAFVESYRIQGDSDHYLLNSQLIHYNTLRNFIPVDNKKVSARLDTLINKYYTPDNNKPYYYNGDGGSESYIGEITKKYNLSTVRESIDHINEKINRFSGEDGGVYFRMWFYFSFFIALLLFIFRHSTVRTFFLSVLSFVIIIIITSLINSFFSTKFSTFFIWCFFYFALFSILGVNAFFNKTRSVVTGIAINSWMLLLPFIPLLITGYYYQHKQEQDMVLNIVTLNYQEMHRNQLIAEIGGPLLFCVLLFTYIHKLYKTWYAQPKE